MMAEHPPPAVPVGPTAGDGCDPGGKVHVLEVFVELINTWDPLLSLRAHLQLLPIQAFPFPSLFYISEHQD